MSKLRKLLLVVVFSAFILFSVFADSITMSTSINSVSYGVSNFGFGLFPIATNFDYYTSYPLFDSLLSPLEFDVELAFDVYQPSSSPTDNNISGYDYQTGKPWWSDGVTYNSLDKKYFRLGTQLSTYLQQGFGINPVEKAGSLVYLRLTFFSRFTYAGESLLLSSEGPGNTVFDKPPFSNGEHLQAYPWLEGDGRTLNNNLAFSTYWYFRKNTGPNDTFDGAYLDLTFEYGPSWLGNSDAGVVKSNYYKASIYFEQYLTVFTVKQDNGWNWLNMMMGHSNSTGYTWGDVIPEHKLQTDRLRGYLNDYLYLRFVGPQFLATDCYPIVQVSLYNNLSFGGVQNDITGEISGIELRSGLSFQFRLRLFGFMNFRFECGYNFINGFAVASPGWWQNAQIGFYVSL